MSELRQSENEFVQTLIDSMNFQPETWIFYKSIGYFVIRNTETKLKIYLGRPVKKILRKSKTVYDAQSIRIEDNSMSFAGKKKLLNAIENLHSVKICGMIGVPKEFWGTPNGIMQTFFDIIEDPNQKISINDDQIYIEDASSETKQYLRMDCRKGEISYNLFPLPYQFKGTYRKNFLGNIEQAKDQRITNINKARTEEIRKAMEKPVTKTKDQWQRTAGVGQILPPSVIYAQRNDDTIAYWSIERESPEQCYNPKKDRMERLTGWLYDLDADEFQAQDVVDYIKEHSGGGAYIIYSCNQKGEQLGNRPISISLMISPKHMGEELILEKPKTDEELDAELGSEVNKLLDAEKINDLNNISFYRVSRKVNGKSLWLQDIFPDNLKEATIENAIHTLFGNGVYEVQSCNKAAEIISVKELSCDDCNIRPSDYMFPGCETITGGNTGVILNAPWIADKPQPLEGYISNVQPPDFMRQVPGNSDLSAVPDFMR